MVNYTPCQDQSVHLSLLLQRKSSQSTKILALTYGCAAEAYTSGCVLLFCLLSTTPPWLVVVIEQGMSHHLSYCVTHHTFSSLRLFILLQFLRGRVSLPVLHLAL